MTPAIDAESPRPAAFRNAVADALDEAAARIDGLEAELARRMD
jgi:hypothetical protein